MAWVAWPAPTALINLKHNLYSVNPLVSSSVSWCQANNHPPGSWNHITTALVFTLTLTPVSYAHSVGPNSAWTSKANLQVPAILEYKTSLIIGETLENSLNRTINLAV